MFRDVRADLLRFSVRDGSIGTQHFLSSPLETPQTACSLLAKHRSTFGFDAPSIRACDLKKTSFVASITLSINDAALVSSA
mmetsp:Transcript_26095/g.55922  ORF Transcript_26095/g.55922 Transcript_26095/m.55922 type:complete len:81 (+) Transcript_26095:289-531(+)